MSQCDVIMLKYDVNVDAGQGSAMEHSVMMNIAWLQLELPANHVTL